MSLTPFTSERANRNTFVTRGTDSDLLVGFVLASQAWQTGDLKSVRYESHPEIKLAFSPTDTVCRSGQN
jgi:hypothetical protein